MPYETTATDSADIRKHVGIDDGELPIESTDSIDDIEAVEEEPEVIPVAGVALDEAVVTVPLKKVPTGFCLKYVQPPKGLR